MQKIFKKISNSIQGKLLISFLTLTFTCSLLISICSYFITYKYLRQRVSESFSMTLDYISSSVQSELNQIQGLSDYLFVKDEVKEAMEYAGNNPSEIFSKYESTYNVLKEYAISHIFENINFITLYGNNGFELTYSINYGDIAPDGFNSDFKELMKKLDYSNGHCVWAGLTKRVLNSERGFIVFDIPMLRIIKDKRYKENVGLMEISLNPRTFSSLIQKYNSSYPEFANTSQVLILDNHNNVINNAINDHSILDKRQIEEILASSEAYTKRGYISPNLSIVAFTKKIEKSDWKVIGTIPKAFITADITYILYMSILSFILSIIICGLIWLYVSSGIFKPLKMISLTMKKIGNGNTNLRIPISRNDEIFDLARNMNNMLERIKTLHKEILERELKMRDALYQARQSQINPHFMYNTLNTIKWMAGLAGAENIQTAINSFIIITKYSTHSNKYFASIREEIEAVKQYVYLCELSYVNKFHVIWDIDNAILDYRCIRFFLQPIVENSIKHGLFPKGESGKIYISVYRENNSIVFNIYDEGVGMSSDTIHKIYNPSPDSSDNVALTNIIERFHYAYGEKCAFDISSDLGKYTNIMIRFPLENGTN